MPRPYHSPSSIALGLSCQYAWAKNYIDHVRDPDLAWSDHFLTYKWDHGASKFADPKTGESHTAQQRGAALGKGMHTTAERWYDPTRGAPDWDWYPGIVFASGKHHLPEPTLIDRVVIEQPIGTITLPEREITREGQPTVALEVDGILWSGFIDNEAHGGGELARIGIHAPDGVAIIDYKSSSSIEKFALTKSELLVDPQGALYSIATCRKLDLLVVPERWVYFESKKIRRSLPVDVNAELSRALDVIGPCADLARVLDMITRSEDAPKNPAIGVTENGVKIPACNMYGPPDRINCRHHVVNGGTCDRRRPMGALVQLTPKKRETEMAMSQEAKDKFAATKERKRLEAEAAANAAAGGTEGADAGDSDDAGTGEAETTAAAPTPPVAASAKPATPAAAAKPTAPAKVGQAATIATLAAELAAADKVREGVLAKLRAAVA